MRLYEVFVILHPRLSEEEVNVFATNLEKQLTDQTPGASVTSRKIEKDSTLAYPIKHQLRGHFLHLELEMSDGEEISRETHSEIQREENVLRYLVFRKSETAPLSSQASFIDRMRAQSHKREVVSRATPKKSTLETVTIKEEMDTEEVDKKIEELLK